MNMIPSSTLTLTGAHGGHRNHQNILWTYCRFCQLAEALTYCSWLDIVEWTRRRQGDDWKNDPASFFPEKQHLMDGVTKNKKVTMDILYYFADFKIWSCIFIWLYDTELFGAKHFLKYIRFAQRAWQLTQLTTYSSHLHPHRWCWSAALWGQSHLIGAQHPGLLLFCVRGRSLSYGRNWDRKSSRAMWNWRFLRDWLKIEQKEISETSRCKIF